MDKIKQTEVAIIGAGLTGLSLGCYLKQRKLSFLVIEKEDHPGGVIKTFRESGFVFEGGPNTGVIGNLEVGALFDDLYPLCELEIANPKAKKRLIWKAGRWEPIPSGITKAITTPLFSLKDKIRILGEPFRRRGSEPMETVAQLVIRRMGKSFLDYAVDPFISGIYAGDPGSLVTKYALPKLYRLEQDYGSFIGGAWKKRSREKGPSPSREVFSVKGGLDHLINALIAVAGNQSVVSGASACRVMPADGGYAIQYIQNGQPKTLHAKQVVSTVGGGQISQLMPFLPADELRRIEKLTYAPVVQVVLGFKRWPGKKPLNAFGGLVPSRENRKILGILFPSAFLSGRAPEGGALLSVFLGGMRNPDMLTLSDGAILDVVKTEVQQMMELPSWNPELVKLFRYPAAIPQYDAESMERLKAIVRLQMKYPGLYLVGNIQEGIGMADRIAQAKRVADLLNG